MWLPCACCCSALLPKTLVAELREAAEKRRQDERALRALSLAYRYDAVLERACDLTYDCSERWGSREARIAARG